MVEELHLKYRPQDFDSVVGHDAIVDSLRTTLDDSSIHAYLFTGPSGVGKTTLARIIARTVECDAANLIEVDAATYTGIDDMRTLTGSLMYHPIGKSKSRVVIIDECHSLSKPAWQSILKAIEEPPPNTYWCLCTTEPSKVPPTIKTRCAAYELGLLHESDIFDLLVDVCDSEGIDRASDQASEFRKILDLIAAESLGSPRQALVYLGMCVDCKDRKEAADVLRTAVDKVEVIDLCRLLIKPQGISWPKIMKIVSDLWDTNPEGVRIVVTAYFSKALLDCKTDDEVQRLLFILEAFSKPYNPNDKLAPLLLSIGEVMYGGGDE